MNYWTNLSRPEDKFVQCPFIILNLNVKPISLKLYLILWQEAFSNPKRYRGIQYAQMTYKDMRQELQSSNTTVYQSIKELVEHKLIVIKKLGKNNIFLFTARKNWR